MREKQNKKKQTEKSKRSLSLSLCLSLLCVSGRTAALLEAIYRMPGGRVGEEVCVCVEGWLPTALAVCRSFFLPCYIFSHRVILGNPLVVTA